ncbi:MAG: hypothetical protein CL946_09665, partial [Ectothiorhodospiraceae bacterium]|nr:hypothetical protein [Ectothiorhodospiraceae bacterium]
MKYLITLIALIIGTSTAIAQDWETMEFRTGDIRIYHFKDDSSRIIHSSGPISNNGLHDTLRLVSDHDIRFDTSDVNQHILLHYRTNYSSGISSLIIDTIGAVYNLRPSSNYPAGGTFWYLITPPSSDTTIVKTRVLGSSYALLFDVHVIDTVVLGDTVQAMVYTQQTDSTLARVMVAERFGLVRYEAIFPVRKEIYMYSAYIDSVAYNWESKPYEIQEFCLDNAYYYDVYENNAYYSSIESVIDEAEPIYPYVYYESIPYFVLYHYDSAGLPFRYRNGEYHDFNYGQDKILPVRELGIGSIVNTVYNVTDTGSMIYEGTVRPWISWGSVAKDSSWGAIYKWLSGIGVTRYLNVRTGRMQSYFLRRASICDSVYIIDDLPDSLESNWYVSLKPGNIRVYVSDTSFIDTGYVVQRDMSYTKTTPPDPGEVDSVYSATYGIIQRRAGEDREIWDMLGVHSSHSLRVRRADGFIVDDIDIGHDTITHVLYLGRSPGKDTVIQVPGSNRFSIKEFRFFDTTVFRSKFRKSFAYKVYDLEKQIAEVIVAKPFGIVRIVGSQFGIHREWYLSSTIIDGRAYNHPNWMLYTPLLCQDYQTTFAIQYHLPETKYNHVSLSDTLIDGLVYKELVGSHALDKELYHHMHYNDLVTEHRLYRFQGDLFQYHDGSEYRVPKSSLSLGSIVPQRSEEDLLNFPHQNSYMVVDTASVVFDGTTFRSARFMRVNLNGIPYQHTDGFTWLESVGLFQLERRVFDDYLTAQLVYARICGQEYGKPVGVPPVPPVASSSEIVQVYPNPVSASHGSVALHTSEEQHGTVHVAI